MISNDFNENLKSLYESYKLENEYVNLMEEMKTLNEEMLLEFLRRDGLPPELIQAYLNTINTPNEMIIRDWGQQFDASKSVKDPMMYAPYKDFSTVGQGYRRRNSDGRIVRATLTPSQEYEIGLNNSNKKTTLTNTSYVYNFVTAIDYGKCHYETLSVEEALNYLGLNYSQVAAKIAEYSGTASNGTDLGTNQNRTSYKGNITDRNAFNNNLSSLRFVFKNDLGVYQFASYDDRQVVRNDRPKLMYYPDQFPVRCFNQEGKLPIGYFINKEKETTLNPKYLSEDATGVVTLIMLSDKIYKTDEFQHRILDAKSASKEEVEQKILPNPVPGNSSTASASVFLSTLVNNGINNNDSLENKYNSYINLIYLADCCVKAKIHEIAIPTNTQSYYDTDEYRTFLTNLNKLGVVRDEAVETQYPSNATPYNKYTGTIRAYLWRMLNEVTLSLENSQTIEEYKKHPEGDFDFIKYYNYLSTWDNFFFQNSYLKYFFTDDYWNKHVNNRNNSNWKYKQEKLTRSEQEFILGEFVDIYYPTDGDASMKRLNQLYKRNLFNSLVIKSDPRNVGYIRSNPSTDVNDPKYIPGFQSYRPLDNYFAYLKKNKNFMYDVIPDTGGHYNDHTYPDQLNGFYQNVKKSKQDFLHIKKVLDKLKQNKDSYGDDEDSVRDYEADLAKVQEKYDAAKAEYLNNLKNWDQVKRKYLQAATLTGKMYHKLLVEYFEILQSKLEQIHILQIKVNNLSTYTLEDILKEFGVNNLNLTELDNKIASLKELLKYQEQALNKVISQREVNLRRIQELEQEILKCKENVEKSYDDEKQVNQSLVDLNKQLEETEKAKNPDKEQVVSKYYTFREETEAACKNIGNEIDQLRKHYLSNTEPDTNTTTNTTKKNAETNPKVLSIFDEMEDTVDEVSDKLQADENDKKVISSLEGNIKLDDLMDDPEDTDEE